MILLSIKNHCFEYLNSKNMFCPRCGQEQKSEEIRFCSRCGFSFEVVAQVLATGGTLPQLIEVDEKQKGWFNRSNGWKFGLVWILVFFLLATVFAMARVDGFPEALAAFGFFGGLLITLFSFIFLKKSSRTSDSEQLNPAQKKRENAASQLKTSQNVLPPEQSIPASAYAPPVDLWKAPDTFELSQPGSVTEGTTKLLEKDE